MKKGLKLFLFIVIIFTTIIYINIDSLNIHSWYLKKWNLDIPNPSNMIKYIDGDGKDIFHLISYDYSEKKIKKILESGQFKNIDKGFETLYDKLVINQFYKMLTEEEQKIFDKVLNSKNISSENYYRYFEIDPDRHKTFYEYELFILSVDEKKLYVIETTN